MMLTKNWRLLDLRDHLLLFFFHYNATILVAKIAPTPDLFNVR